MKVFVNCLIYLIYVQIITAKKFASYTHLECPEPHVNIVTDYNCTLTKNTRGFLMMSTGFKFKQDLHNIMANFKVKIRRGPKLLETYLNMNLDICEALSAAHKHFLLKMIALEIMRTSNLPVECPLKKNVYYFIRNFSLNDYYIPPYVPEMEFGSYTDFYVNNRKYLTFNSFGKIMDSKKGNRNSLTVVKL